ncbi:MAG TPA: HWE histidine kinase domain-containing protein [Rhizomicrobium sp.]|jgi:PAS domain S-box-containing protein
MIKSEFDNKVNILLVDDQPAKLISYEVMLGELNENLVKASSAREAFAYLLKNEAAVVLVDVCMPELDGFELAAMIREHPRFERTAIIFVSAIHMADDDRLRGYRMGAVDYMPVPVVPDILRAKVKVFAELYRKTRELESLNTDLENRVAERTAQLAASTTRLLESEKRRSVALGAGRMGSWDWDLESDNFHWDEELCRMVGVDPVTFRVSAETVRPLVDPEDWQSLEALLADAHAGKGAFQFELRFLRPEGELRWCSVTAAASYDGAGRLVRLSGVAADITQRKTADDRHALLAREVDHRAKNALALVQSILRLTRADTIEQYRQAVDGRIASLSHAHTLLSESRWQGAELGALVTEELAPYGRDDIAVDGDSVLLQPATAQSLALVLHELATNSAKYGSLSIKEGRLSVRWSRMADGLRFSWMEAGGPRVKPPKKQGFGAKVIRSTVEGQLRGSVAFYWEPAGLRCDFTIPIAQTESPLDEPHTTRKTKKRARPAGNAVLLVEDEVLVGLMMRDVLEDNGIRTLGPYGTVKDALLAARSGGFDGAILDVNLNGEMVYPVAEFLLSENVPFAFVTGYGRETIDPRFRNVPLLRKPVDHNALKTFLKDFVSKSRVEAPLQHAVAEAPFARG